MASTPTDWTVEYQGPNGDWHLAMAGRKWKTHAGALKAMLKWKHEQLCDCAWNPPTRCIELVNSYNDRGVSSLAVRS